MKFFFLQMTLELNTTIILISKRTKENYYKLVMLDGSIYSINKEEKYRLLKLVYLIEIENVISYEKKTIWNRKNS